jgi:hypothetical protein
VFSRARETDLFRPSLVHRVLQNYTFLYSTFHTAVHLMWLKMSSADNRKHKTLNLSATAEIITNLDKSEKLINLAKDSGVGHATIYDIRTFSSNPAVPWSHICRITKIVLYLFLNAIMQV